jgi:AcrR family transcriptional regulator
MSAPKSDESPKARIMMAASAELARMGPKRFTVIGVAEAAHMTHPNIYRYFTSKTALMDALVAQWLQPLEERIEMVVAAPDPVPDKLERMVAAISRAYREAKAENLNLFLAFAVANTANRAVIRKHRLRLRRAFDRVIDEGIASEAIGLRDRTKAQALLTDACWRFIDPASVLVEADTDAGVSARLERVLESVLGNFTRRRLVENM